VLLTANTRRAVLFSVMFYGCMPPMECQNQQLSSVSAPNRELRAVTFERSCGATTGFSTQISLLGTNEEATTSGNLFIADTDHGKAPSGPGGGPRVSAEWRGADTLLIRHHPNARVFKAEKTLGGVVVLFEHDSLP
jgi:hypothetical protein